ncbi:paired domain-containing protein [Trichonephila clavipes]|nr:paired domain-containing protein [Trichonephila clavipes]
MEMGLSQADAARRLNVSRFVQRLWDQYQILCPEDLFGRPRATTPAEEALSARRRSLARCRPLSSIRKKNLRYYGAKSSSQCRSVCKLVVCVPLNGRQRRNRLCWAREHVSWTQQQWASVLLFRFMESDSWRLLLEGTAH